METIQIEVQSDNKGIRIDKFLLEALSEHAASRSFIQQLITAGHVLVNDQSVKKNYVLRGDEHIQVQLQWQIKGDHFQVQAENIPLDIVFEDDYLLVINKPVDMVVHPAPGNKDSTLVNALLYHSQSLSDCNSEIRPGIVHRLDKDTCGLLVVAKDNKTHYLLAEAMKNREIKREYMAIVAGEIRKGDEIDVPIGRSARNRLKMAVNSEGKPARTIFVPEKILQGATLLRVQLETGRTHQIRVHLAYRNHPVLGDPLYAAEGSVRQAAGVKHYLQVLKVHHSLQQQALQAIRLSFVHPITQQDCSFSVPLAAHLQEVIATLS